MKTKKIFVTGAMGFIGLHWCKKLLNEGHKVYALDIKDSNTELKKNKNFFFYKESVFNYVLVKKLVKKTDITCHFAGIASPKEYLVNTTKVINLTVNPSLKIVDFCKKYQKKLFFTSTSEIYGKSNEVPFLEEGNRLLGSTSVKRWCYSTSKALVEHAIFANLTKKSSFVIFRLFNVYGPGLEGRVVDIFIKNAIANKNLNIFGKGSQKRCFLYIDDCIEIFYEIFKKKILPNEVINIGNNISTSVNDLAKKIIKIANSNSKIVKQTKKKISKMRSEGYEDISLRVPSLQKLHKMVIYRPKFNLNIGLKKYYNSIKLNDQN
jgi:UDP-glucose 4-epimerase